MSASGVRDPYFMGRVSFPQTANNQGGGLVTPQMVLFVHNFLALTVTTITY